MIHDDDDELMTGVEWSARSAQFLTSVWNGADSAIIVGDQTVQASDLRAQFSSEEAGFLPHKHASKLTY